jgi:hypothetical protein
LDDRKQHEPREVIGYAMATLFVFTRRCLGACALDTE